jgi:hypothetical protein
LLPFHQRQASKVVSIEPQQVERSECQETLAFDKIAEHRLSPSIEGDNFPIQDDLARAEHLCHTGAELAKAIEPEVSTGSDLTAQTGGVGHPPKSVVFGLEQPVRVVKRFWS